MKNKRIMSIIMITITILLIITILGITSNTIIIETQKRSNIYKMASNVEYKNNENTEGNTNEEQLMATLNNQELRVEANYEDTETASSRSAVDRQQVVENEEMYINLNMTNEQQEDEQAYEEIIQYIKLEDVKISFDMDVSKTTGLSKEDFIYLVQKMKYDKTGILEKNAGWIWECCKKYNVNEIFVLGICGIESAWCSASQHQRTHNYSSLMKGGKLIQYASDEAGFEAMIKLLGQKYLTPGASLYHGSTITGVGRSYCNATTWPKKVYTCMQQVFQ